jgi:hypothetical protein
MTTIYHGGHATKTTLSEEQVRSIWTGAMEAGKPLIHVPTVRREGTWLVVPHISGWEDDGVQIVTG